MSKYFGRSLAGSFCKVKQTNHLNISIFVSIPIIAHILCDFYLLGDIFGGITRIFVNRILQRHVGFLAEVKKCPLLLNQNRVNCF